MSTICDTYTKVTAVDAIYEIFSESLEELKAENERLKALCHDLFFEGGHSYITDKREWLNFKTKNNL